MALRPRSAWLALVVLFAVWCLVCLASLLLCSPQSPCGGTHNLSQGQIGASYPLASRENGKGDIKVAYLVLLHSLDSVLAAERLLPAIWQPQFIYLILSDKDMDNVALDRLNQFLASGIYTQREAKQPDNVRRVTCASSAPWGSIGLVQNTLDGLQELLSWNQTWDYAINLSGDTYPLMSQGRCLADGEARILSPRLEGSPITNTRA
jgi:hypothetical protein